MKIKLLPVRTIKVHYDDGDSMITRIRATIPECAKMYLDKPMIAEDYETGKEYRKYGRAIEFLDRNMYINDDGDVNVIKRVYSISDKFKEKNVLYNKFRFTESVYKRSDWMFGGEDADHYKHDAAFLIEHNHFERVGYSTNGKTIDDRCYDYVYY